jgi:hypothetical protein
MAKKSRSRERKLEPARAAAARVHVRPADEGDGANRKARKEEARRERERIQRAMVRRKRLGRGAVGLVVIALIAVVGFLLLGGDNGTTARALPGMLTTKAPWPANSADLRERLQAIGLPALGKTATAQHTHEHLDIYVDGNKVQVPPDIGIGSTFLSPLHTHDPAVTQTSDSATIHVEAPDTKVYTLGEFFDVWGVRLTSDCLGGYCTGSGKSLQAFVNGKPAPNPRAIALKEHEEIVLAYGTPSKVPSPVPSTFKFINGE